MTEKTEKVEAPAKETLQLFNFTRAGITIEAKNLQEAQEKFAKTLEKTKESDNG